MSETKELKFRLLELQNRVERIEKELKLRENLGGSNETIFKSNRSHSLETEFAETNRPLKMREILIGKLTSLLITRDYFPSNKELVDFAVTQLGIKLPHWRSRSRSEIIGATLEKVSKLDSTKIRRFYRAAMAFESQESQVKDKRKSFFDAWEQVIRELQFRG